MAGKNSQNASISMSRDDYVAALQNKKNLISGVGNSAAYYNKNPQQKTASEPNWFEQALSTGHEAYQDITTGIMSFVEGVGDALGTVAAWSVDTFGGLSDKMFGTEGTASGISNWITDNLVKTQWSDKVGKFMADYANPYQIGYSIYSMTSGTPDARENSNSSWSRYLGSTGQQIYNQSLTAIGEMLPSIAIGDYVGAATTASELANGVDAAVKIGKAAGEAASLTAMGISAAGHGAEEALLNGGNLNQAMAYGALTGGTEVLTEKLSSLIPGLKSIPGALLGDYSKSTFAKLLLEMAAEGFEEVISDALNPLWKKLTYQKDLSLKDTYTDWDFYKELVVSFTVGALVGGIMSTPGTVMNTINNKRANDPTTVKFVQENQETFDGLNLGKDLIKEKTAQKNAALQNNDTKTAERLSKEINNIANVMTKLTSQIETAVNGLSKADAIHISNALGIDTYVTSIETDADTATKSNEYNGIAPVEAIKPIQFSTDNNVNNSVTQDVIKQEITNNNVENTNNNVQEQTNNAAEQSIENKTGVQPNIPDGLKYEFDVKQAPNTQKETAEQRVSRLIDTYIVKPNENARTAQKSTFYGQTSFDGNTVKLTGENFENYSSEVENLLDDIPYRENDYGQAVKKNYVNKLNRISANLLNYLQDIYDPNNFDVEENINTIEELEQHAEYCRNLNDRIQDLISEIENSDYDSFNTDMPDYSDLEELASYLDDVENYYEDSIEDINEFLENKESESNKEITDTDVKTEKLEENAKNVSTKVEKNDIVDSQKGDDENDFRRLQEESRARVNQESWGKESKNFDDNLQRRLSRTLQEEIKRRGYSDSTNHGLLELSYKDSTFKVYEKVDGATFHDIFEVARAYLENGELVDLHDEEDSEEHGIGYKNCTNYLSDDGMSGFSITPKGDLISVFNLSIKRGWLRAISPIISEKAYTLDCYASEKQNLQEMYTKVFGFKTASLMDWNPKYDHDSIGETHNKPKVAFMVNTPLNVEMKTFEKTDYDGAVKYQQEIVKREKKRKRRIEIKASYDVSFTSIKTTEGIVKNLFTVLEGMVSTATNKDANVRLQMNKGDIVNQTFDEINKKKKSREIAEKIIDNLLESKVESYNAETQQYEDIGKVKDNLLAENKEALIKSLQNVIETAPDSKVRDTAIRDLKKQLQIALNTVKERSNRISVAKKITRKRITLPNHLKQVREWTDDNRAYHTGSLLLEPFVNLNDTSLGFNGAGKSYIEDGVTKHRPTFKDAIGTILKEYTADKYSKIDGGEALYDDEIRKVLEDIYENIPEPVINKNGNYRYVSFDAAMLNKINDAFNMIKSFVSEQERLSIREYTPAATQTVNSFTNKYNKAANVKLGFAALTAPINASYSQVRLVLGENSLTETMTTEYQQAESDRIMYVGNNSYIITEKIKELNLHKKLGKKITLNGVKIQADFLVELYNDIKTPENLKALDESGLQVKTEKGNLVWVIKPGKSAEAVTKINKIFDKNKSLKKYAEFLKEFINGDIKEDYKKWYKSRYSIEPNELNDYWQMNRVNEIETSAEKMIQAPALFKQSISRVKNTHPLLAVSATNKVTAYIETMGKQIYTMPVYRKVIKILNTKVDGRTVKAHFNEILGTKHQKWLSNYLDSLAGISKNKEGVLSFLTSGYTLSKLSLNVGTAAKQVASIWTSNIPVLKSLAGGSSYLFSKKVRAEFSELNNEIGSLKYRAKNSNLAKTETTRTTFGTVQELAQKGMFMAIGMDKFTIDVGVLSLMYIGEQNGYKVGTEANKNFVKQHWLEFELSQLGSGANSINAISRGDYGQLARCVFGIMQGANRAATGSNINKMATWLRNVNVNETELNAKAETTKNKITELNVKISELESKLDDPTLTENEINDINSDLESAEKEYQKAKVDYENNRVALEDYARYKVMGGKSIPVNTAAGLIVQALYVTLITEFIKHLKGQKDWDDWNITDLSVEFSLSALINWIPVVNTISSAIINDYDVTAPSITIVSDFVKVGTNVKDMFVDGYSSSKMKEIARTLIDMACSITGLPVKNVYDYVYGIVKTSNPETAVAMNNVFYNVTQKSLTEDYKKAIENGKINKANSILKGNFKLNITGDIPNDSVINEFTRLVRKGNTGVMPTHITNTMQINGESVKITNAEKEQLKKEYSKANAIAAKVISSTYYKKLDDAAKAKVLKSIYTSYWSAAKIKTFKLDEENHNRLSLLTTSSLSTNSLSNIFVALNTISSMKDDGKKTRKEQVVSYINKMSITGTEKYLIYALAGYKLTDDQTERVKSYLKSKNISKDNINSLLNIE